MPTESGDEVRHEWQEQLMRQLAELVKSQQSTAVTLERINGRLDNLDQRLKAQESGPDALRNWLGTGGGCLSTAIFASMSLLSLLLSALAMMLPHLK